MLTLTYSPSGHMIRLHMAEAMLGYPKDTRSARRGPSRECMYPHSLLSSTPRGTPALLSSSMQLGSLSLSHFSLIKQSRTVTMTTVFDFTHPPVPGMFSLDYAYTHLQSLWPHVSVAYG
jgi:hypothetical protein